MKLNGQILSVQNSTYYMSTNSSDSVSTEQPEKLGIIHSEMEFDPENTPRDPLPQGCLEENTVPDDPSESEDIPLLITLDTIPVEILLIICDYLEASLIRTLSQVCQSFQTLFSNEMYWRIRLKKRWPKKYPPVDGKLDENSNDLCSVDEVDWRRACEERERSYRLWSQPDEHMEHFVFDGDLYASIDVVHLMQGGRFLAAGSRDRYLTLLDLSKYNSSQPGSKKEMKLHCIDKAHNGWIWSMDSLDNLLYTGSWDTNIKVWDLERDFTVVNKYKCRSAVLDLHVETNFLVAGGFDKKVYFFDPRQNGIITTKRWHRQPVLCIAADENYIISGSEDKTFSIYDRRAGCVFKSISVDNYPLDVSYHSNQLWFGDKQGNLTLMDATMGKFEVVKTYNVGHTDKLTGVVHTEGAIFTSSNDSTIKVLEPSLDPEPINTLTKHRSGVAGISYQNGVLASAGCDIVVGIWRPKADGDFTAPA